jgi:hypothetical protein
VSYSVRMKKKAENTATQTWRPTNEDLKLMAELKGKLGIVNTSDLLRMSLRKLAEAEGLQSR